MDAIIYTTIILVSVLAIICLVKFLSSIFFEKRNEMLCFFTLIPVSDLDEDIEYTVRSIIWSRSWEWNQNQHIILVLKNCSEETIAICEKICQEYEPVSMCLPDQLSLLVDDPASAVTKLWYNKGMN